MIFDKIDALKNDALYLSAIAELLYEIGFDELGESLANQALDIGPCFAACYATVGRIHILNGQIEEGIGYIDHCLEMTDKNTDFYHLLMAKKSLAYKALGEQDKLNEMTQIIFDLETNHLYKILKKITLLDDLEKNLPLSAKAAIHLVPKKYIRKFLNSLFFGAVRTFKHEHHRANIFRSLIQYLVAIHGESVVPILIKESVPSLFTGTSSQINTQVLN